MTDLVRMTSEDFDALGHQMRLANTQRLKAILDSLEPYVDGSFGSINPGHVTAYVRTVAELGKLWRAYDRPVAAPEGSDESQAAQVEAMVLSARQEAVLAELGKLRQVGMKEQGRRKG